MDVLAALWRRVWPVALCLALGLIGALVAVGLTTSVYESQSRILLTPISPDGGTTFGSTGYLAARGRSYASIAQSGAFREAVTSSLGRSSGEGFPLIVVDLELDTTLLVVTVRDTTADDARRGAERVGDLLIAESSTFDVTPDGAPQLRLDVVSRPLPGAAIGPDVMNYLALGGFAGLVLGAAVVYARARAPFAGPAESAADTDSDYVHVSSDEKRYEGRHSPT